MIRSGIAVGGTAALWAAKEKRSIAVAERRMQSTEERWQGAESKCQGGEKH